MIAHRGWNLLAVCLIAVAVAQLDTRAQERPDRVTPPDRTTPILKRMTKAQRVHARLYTGPRYNQGGRLLDRGQSVHISIDGLSQPPTLTTSGRLSQLLCASDAAFIGLVQSVDVWPNEDGSFLFSEYAVNPSEVFRSAAGGAVAQGRALTVVRPGGQMMVDGTEVSASIDTLPPLRLHERYLFFVKYIPATGAYETSVAEDALGIQGSSVNTGSTLNVTDRRVFKTGLPLADLRSLLSGAQCN
jgi:hypothetical protein